MTVLGRGRLITVSAERTEALSRCDSPKQPLGYLATQASVEATQQAKRILDDARAAAAALLAQANQQIAQLREEIREQVKSELNVEHVQRFAELATLRSRVVQRAKEEIVQLAGVLAQRIIGEELSLDPGKQMALACEVLREVSGAKRVTIHASPEAAELLRRELCRLETTTLAPIEVAPDVGLSHGDLRIETDVGSIDARLETQISHLVCVIVESLRS